MQTIMEMYEIICDEIEKILKDSKLAAPILNLHLPKRAKFERYLQSVLAYQLKTTYVDTEIEKEYPNNNNSHVDIFSNGTYIELKTPNTNYTLPEIVKDKNVAITDNINGIIEDIKKLQEARVKKGVVAFVLFPIDNDGKYKYHVDRVKQELGSNSFKDCIVDRFYIFSAKV